MACNLLYAGGMRYFIVPLLVLLPVSASAYVGGNGIDMNGIDMNGIDMNGIDMNGIDMNGIDMNGADMGDQTTTHDFTFDGGMLEGTIADTPHPVTGVWCPHSELTVGPKMPTSCSRCSEWVGAADSYCPNTSWDSACVSAASTLCAFDGYDLRGAANGDMQGAYMWGTKSNGTSVKLMIDSVSVISSTKKTYKYEVHWRKPSYYTCSKLTGVCTYHAASWQPICPNYSNGGTEYNKAIAIPGTFSSTGRWQPGDGWAFSCRDKGAPAKCTVNFNYRPWVSPNGDHFEACTRMVRADYCGNGVYHTANGTQIDVYDGNSINTNSSTVWAFEASWDHNGVNCASNPRFNGADPNPYSGADTIADYVAWMCSAKYDTLADAADTCSTKPFGATWGMLRNESSAL